MWVGGRPTPFSNARSWARSSSRTSSGRAGGCAPEPFLRKLPSSSRSLERESVGPRGRPKVRTKWRPVARERRRRASSNAASAAGAFTIRDVEVTIPSWCASTIPSTTPGLSPKSSAVTTSRFIARIVSYYRFHEEERSHPPAPPLARLRWVEASVDAGRSSLGRGGSLDAQPGGEDRAAHLSSNGRSLPQRGGPSLPEPHRRRR